MSEMKLNDEEKELLESYEADEWQSVDNLHEAKETYNEYARATFKKDRRVNIRISGGDLVLREVAESDLPIFFEHQRDPDANHMAAFPARDWDAFMAHWTKILGDDTITKKTILFDGQVAGNIVSFEQSGEPQVGYWIGKEYWGKGVATRALSKFLGHVKVRPLYAHVAKHNIASVRVLEKCGFTICGEDKASSHAGGKEVEEYILKFEANERDEAP